MSTGSPAVVVTQRERFEPSVESLRNVLATVPNGTQIVSVDAGSPPAVADELARVAADPLEHHDLVWLSAHRLYGNLAYGGAMGSMPGRSRRAFARIVDRGRQTVLHAKRSTLRTPPPEVRVVHPTTWQSAAPPVGV